MKYAPRKVFIIENGEYIELTYAEFNSRKETDRSYEDKLFLPVQGCLLESDRKHYKEFYQDKEHNIYLKKLDKKYGLLSIDAFDSDDDNGTDYIQDYHEDVADTVADSLMKERLSNGLSMLSDKERELIDLHFFKNISQVDIAKNMQKNQSTISRKISKILGKLKKFLEN